MKKALAIILAGVLCCGLLAGCGQSSAQPTDDSNTQSSGEKKTFTVGFDAEFPPFGFVADDGSYDGFDLAIAKEVCSRLDWEFKAQPISWDAKDAELKAGNIDCIWNGFTYQGREDAYSWTPAYYDNSIVMVVRADSGIQSLADLKGKNVIVQTDSSAQTALAEDTTGLTDSFGQLLDCADYNSAFMELDQGTADAVAADLGVAKYNMKDKGDKFVILDQQVASETYAIGFLKGNDALANTVWEQVKAIAADGTMEKIAQNYVDKGLVIDCLTLLKQ